MKVIYPGSFDPITLGHVDIIERLLDLDYQVTILVAQSSRKETLFSADERVSLVKAELQQHLEKKGRKEALSRVQVETFEGLTSSYMKTKGIQLIVRGLRAVSDYEYEMTMAQVNKKLYPDCETLFMPASSEFHFVSSRGVKEIALNNGELSHFVSQDIQTALMKKLFERKSP